jgi:hypothetical protein
VHLVDDEPDERHPGGRQPLVERERLVHRHRLGARDEHEADARLAQERERLVGALAEAAEDVVELGEEHPDVLDELAADELREPLQHERAGLADERPPRAALALELSEPIDRGRVDRVGELARRVEKVERV